MHPTEGASAKPCLCDQHFVCSNKCQLQAEIPPMIVTQTNADDKENEGH